MSSTGIRHAVPVLLLAVASLLFAQTAPKDAALRNIPLKKLPLPVVRTTIQPTVAHVHGRNALCYEIYITNVGSSPMQISRVQAYPVDSGAVLLDVSGHALDGVVMHSTKDVAPAAKETLAPGEQVVFYAWIDLPAGAAPKAIRHVLTLRPAGGDEVRIPTPAIPVKPATTVIASPLRGGNWVAANGPSNTSGHRRAIIPLDGVARVPQRFAIDWVQVDKSGKTFSGDQKKNESYYCYGKKVHAVANGVVTEVKDGIPQNVPGADSRAVPITLETIGGNHIILDLGGGVYAFYAHLQPGSLKVKVGDRVKAGQVLALVGNSGNSTEPHLHFHLIDRSSPLAGEGLPFSYPAYELLGKGSIDDKSAHIDWLPAAKAVHNEIPAENDIVQFAPESK